MKLPDNIDEKAFDWFHCACGGQVGIDTITKRSAHTLPMCKLYEQLMENNNVNIEGFGEKG